MGNYPGDRNVFGGETSGRESLLISDGNLSKHGRWRKRASAEGEDRASRLFSDPSLKRMACQTPRCFIIWYLTFKRRRLGQVWIHDKDGRGVAGSSQWLLSPLSGPLRHSPDTWVWLSTSVNNVCVFFGDGLANWPKCKPGVFLNMAGSNRG